MAEKSPDGTVPRRINDPLDVGSANDGRDIRVNLRMEDGSTEWFDIDHSKLGRLIAGFYFAASVAAGNRPKTTPGGNAMPELSTVIDPSSVQATSAPGLDFVVLRMVVGEGVNLDFRLPLSGLEAIQGLLDQAAAVAQSGTSSAAH